MQDKIIYTPSVLSIETNAIGVSELLKFYAFAKQYRFKSITLNLAPLNLIDANLAALILALVHKLKIENNLYIFVEIASHMNVLFRNGLIAHMSGKGNINKFEDNRHSTIPLTTFGVDDDVNFCNYLKTILNVSFILYEHI